MRLAVVKLEREGGRGRGGSEMEGERERGRGGGREREREGEREREREREGERGREGRRGRVVEGGWSVPDRLEPPLSGPLSIYIYIVRSECCMLRITGIRNHGNTGPWYSAVPTTL